MAPSTYTLGQLAEIINGDVRGDSSVAVRGINTLAAAGPEEISFATGARRAQDLLACRAGAVLLPRGFGPTVAPAILCDSVEAAVGKTLNLFAPVPFRPPTGVHPTAVIDASAHLGCEVAVGPHVVIERGAVVGDGGVLHAGVFVGEEVQLGAECVLWPNVVVRERCRLGKRVTVHPNAVIGADGFGYFLAGGAHQKIAHAGVVEIADDVEIGAGACIDRAKFGATSIGCGTKIDNLVQVAHNVCIGEHCVIAGLAGIAGSVHLGDGVAVGGQVGIRDHAVIRDGVRIAAMAGVVRDPEAGMTIAGYPARERRRYWREVSALGKLPELIAQVRALGKRVHTLETAADHRQKRGT